MPRYDLQHRPTPPDAKEADDSAAQRPTHAYTFQVCFKLVPITITIINIPQRSHNGLPLVVLLAIQDSENSEEQVDYVQIKANSSRNLLFDMRMSHDELCIHEYVSGEY